MVDREKYSKSPYDNVPTNYQVLKSYSANTLNNTSSNLNLFYYNAQQAAPIIIFT